MVTDSVTKSEVEKSMDTIEKKYQNQYCRILNTNISVTKIIITGKIMCGKTAFLIWKTSGEKP